MIVPIGLRWCLWVFISSSLDVYTMVEIFYMYMIGPTQSLSSTSFFVSNK